MILLIDTSTEKATVCLAHQGKLIDEYEDDSQMNHAAFLQPAVKKISDQNCIVLKELDAIAVNSGPGSYTGLRVGMASAKGLCYALNLPLITISSLELMATAVIDFKNASADTTPYLVCPMIDARRMEIFTAVYDQQMKEIISPCAMLINEQSFSSIPAAQQLLITGSGAEKVKPVLQHQTEIVEIINLNSTFAKLAEREFCAMKFTNLAYSEPQYLKAVYIQGR